MNKLCGVANFVNENAIGTVSRRHMQMAVSIHVLSVGPVGRGSIVHDVLLQVPNFLLSIATDYRELWVIPKQEAIHLVIFHNTLSTFELEESCRLIRQQWPHARILVVCRREGFLDDELYDDRVAPNVSPEALHATIGRLTGEWADRRFGNAEL
jgi:hypothetical protein